MSGYLKVKVTTIGDTLTLTETPNGYALPYEDVFEDVMDAARKERKFRNVLRELAKRQLSGLGLAAWYRRHLAEG